MIQQLWNAVRQRLRPPPQKSPGARGILVFTQTGEVIAAHRLLQEAGMPVSVKGPPPSLRTGCDMVVEFPFISVLHILNLLKEASIEPLQAVAVRSGLLEPVSLYNIKDFGPWIMVRAANMKITVEKSTNTIVNISGGGCPDVPYLAGLLTGKTLDQAPSPDLYGHTLCGYALHLAFVEVKRLCRG